MRTYNKMLVAVAASTLLAASAFSQSAKNVRGGLPNAEIKDASASKLAADAPLSAVSVRSTIAPLPKGVKVLARVPLEGTPITRMYTQREYGHTFLYIEHGQHSLTTVDVTKKRRPRIVEHQPADVEPVRYEPLSEGGSIEIWPRHVTEGLDSSKSVLETSDPNDAKLLQTFVADNNNLVDRDRRLVYFA